MVPTIYTQKGKKMVRICSFVLLLISTLLPATARAAEAVFCEQYFYGVIDQDTVGLFIEKVEQADCEVGSTLRVHISSGGGDPQAAMGLYDWLQVRKAHTVAMGDVASAAVPLYLAGLVRTALPHTRFLVHPGNVIMEGMYNDRDRDELEARDQWDDDLYERIIAERTGLPLDQVSAMVTPFRVFGVTEAREWGFVTD